MRRKVRVFVVLLGFLFYMFDLEEGIERRLEKVAFIHPQALEEGENPSEGMRKPWEERISSHVW